MSKENKGMVRTRLLKGFGANTFGQAVTIVTQLFSLPIFLSVWGAELYGEWLILTALVTFTAMSDIGFSTVTANEMTMKIASGKKAEALSIYCSSFLLITGVSLSVLFLVVICASFLSISDMFNFSMLTHDEVAAILIIMTLAIIVDLQKSLLSAGYQCEGNYAVGVFISNVFRLFDFIIIIVAVLLEYAPTVVATAYLFSKVLSYFYMRMHLRNKSPWLYFKFHYASFLIIRKLTRPSFASMGLRLGSLIGNQGIVMVIGMLQGAVAVTLFTALRTLSRMGFQVVNMINNSVMPEMARAWGRGDINLAKKLHRHSCQISLWLSSFVVVILYFFGALIFDIWTQNQLIFSPVLFGLLLVMVVFNAFWSTSSVVHVALNKHQKIAVFYILITIVAIIFSLLFVRLFGTNGAALSLLIIDVIMVSITTRGALVLLGDNTFSFYKTLLIPPFKRTLWATKK